MTRTLTLCLTPIALTMVFALPTAEPDAKGLAAASGAAVAVAPVGSGFHRAPPAGLRHGLADALHAAVPGASANGLHVMALDHASTGIGDWHRVTGTARIGTGDTAAGLRFAARYDAASGQVDALKLAWSAPGASALAEPARDAIEAAAREALRAEFPEQSPDVELLAIARHRPMDGHYAAFDDHRVFRGRGRINFGDEGEVIAPIEVVFDAEARVVSLRYSLDELDPAPFDDAPIALEAPRLASR